MLSRDQEKRGAVQSTGSRPRRDREVAVSTPRDSTSCTTKFLGDELKEAPGTKVGVGCGSRTTSSVIFKTLFIYIFSKYIL